MDIGVLQWVDISWSPEQSLASQNGFYFTKLVDLVSQSVSQVLVIPQIQVYRNDVTYQSNMKIHILIVFLQIERFADFNFLILWQL
jgi:hypothetical protein